MLKTKIVVDATAAYTAAEEEKAAAEAATHAQLNNTKIKEKKNEKKQLVRKFQEDNNKSRTIKAIKTKTTSAKKQKKSKSKFDNLQEMLLAGVIQSGKNVLVVYHTKVLIIWLI